MTVKQFLNQALQTERLIRSKRRQIQQLISLSYVVSDESAAKIIQLEREQAADVERYIHLNKQITTVIESLEDARYIDILRRRYLCGETWEVIAISTGYELRYVHKLHGRALVALEKIINL